MDSTSGGEDEGIFKGKITALMGSFMQVRGTPSLFRPRQLLSIGFNWSAPCGVGGSSTSGSGFPPDHRSPCMMGE
jgi:hypothetical protein